MEQFLPIYDALYKNPIKHILARHEQGAIHAAEGYARVSGKIGVVIATSGPGATNLVTGIADAMMDSIPLVVFTGQVATTVIGTDAFQEADIIGITQPITKHNYQVKDVADFPRIINEAFHIASTGRPGPVVVDIPKNIATGLFVRRRRRSRSKFARVSTNYYTELFANSKSGRSYFYSETTINPCGSRCIICKCNRRT